MVKHIRYNQLYRFDSVVEKTEDLINEDVLVSL